MVLQGVVACLVAVGVVQMLEVVYVEQAYAQRRALALGIRDFTLVGVLEAAAVEYAGKLILVHLAAQPVEFVFKLAYLELGRFDLVARCDQFVARARGIELHRARVLQQRGKHRVELRDVVGLAYFVRVAFESGVIAVGAFRQTAEPVDEARDQALQRVLGFLQAVSERALFVDYFLEPLLRLVDGVEIQGARDDLLQ